MSDPSPPHDPKPPTALPPVSTGASTDDDATEAASASEDKVSPKGEIAEAFQHMKKAASKLAAKADPALKGASEAVESTFKKVDPALKGVGERVDAVIDKMDPAFDAATAEAKRIASKVAKSAEPMTRQMQEGIGRFADRLGKWARGSDQGKGDEE